jgi:hypothetical protein
MPAMHAPFVQPSFVNGVQHSLVVVVALAPLDEPHDVNSSARTLAENSHAPPFVYSVSSLPLRI